MPESFFRRWLTILGPGAIIASLTIGAGELVFSSRGGSLFGYALLKYFAIVCVIKWALVLMTARHMVLTGVHPLQRWCDLPGPRGWLVWVLLILGVIAFPIWVGFHAGTIGTLISSLLKDVGWDGIPVAGQHYVYGMFVLVIVMTLVKTGSYSRLENIQMGIVIVMLLCVSISLYFLKPPWTDVALSLVRWEGLKYPDWIDRYPAFSGRPLWVELAAYVGVLGGSGYDYLAYVSFLREKGWGAASSASGAASFPSMPPKSVQDALKFPWIDATFSFCIVFVFSAIFVLCGTLVLRPAQLIPDGTDLLTLQAKFVDAGSGWMRPLYFVGAFLAMFGTLYGTIEVAPTVLREILRALFQRPLDERKLHRWSTTWVGVGGGIVLAWSFLWSSTLQGKQPPGLITLLDPANLFTGVLACGLICGVAVWSEFRYLPGPWRSPWWIICINLMSCGLFVLLGIKAYWDFGGLRALTLLAGTVGCGLMAALIFNRLSKRD